MPTYEEMREERAREITRMSEELATDLLVAIGRVHSDKDDRNQIELDLIQEVAGVFRPGSVSYLNHLNLEQAVEELQRRVNATQPRPSFLRRAIGPLAFLALAGSVSYLEWLDVNGDRAIYAELDRQVGNADETRLGMDVYWKWDGQAGARVEVRRTPVSAWQMLQRLDGRVNELETYSVDTRYGWSGVDGDNNSFFFDNAEVGVLASDHTHDLLRVQLDGDLDGDGVKNGEDDCIDIAGIVDDPDDPDHYSAGGNGCPATVDADEDGVADYRDDCVAPVPEGEEVADRGTMRGPKSLFRGQGCSPSQMHLACRKSALVEGDGVPAGTVALSDCPGDLSFQCVWDGSAYKDCATK